MATSRQEGVEEGIARGIEEGREQGRQEGIQQGRQEGIQQGRQEGIQQGRQEGIQQNTIAIARSCKQQGLDTETIMAITQLSREDIEAL
ncbi:MAG: hypothetical protein F6K31_19735 [Symploca sp. SIO2G7]|nr:hypothetical protein [Symploca sp. SIO2G7]